MSYGREDTEKDIVLFLTAEDAVAPSSESGATSTAAAANEAYNEATGEINWDCPCIAPMVQPPCGEVFKEAFSCFVYSQETPKGIDCVEQFRSMQSCFREHPDIYGAELDDDEDEAGSADQKKEGGKA
ncbi:hypothetical protein BC831DRAFT_453964 [Entophlyctis helioformis]|nr:hypothetical protein BC831DRAFT_453964 [Entophlyctis helioformis]